MCCGWIWILIKKFGGVSSFLWWRYLCFTFLAHCRIVFSLKLCNFLLYLLSVLSNHVSFSWKLCNYWGPGRFKWIFFWQIGCRQEYRKHLEWGDLLYKRVCAWERVFTFPTQIFLALRRGFSSFREANIVQSLKKKIKKNGVGVVCVRMNTTDFYVSLWSCVLMTAPSSTTSRRAAFHSLKTLSGRESEFENRFCRSS